MLLVAAIGITVAALLPSRELGINLGGAQLHILAFSILAALSAAMLPRASTLWLLAALAAFGGGIELLQAMAGTGREASWMDWLSDIGASAVTLAAIRILRPAMAAIVERLRTARIARLT